MKLLASSKQTLEAITKLCKSEERATTTLRKIQADEAVSVNAVYGRGPKRASKRNKRQQIPKDCKYCGRSHPPEMEACKAFGETCNYCKGLNHFELMCVKKSFRATSLYSNYRC